MSNRGQVGDESLKVWFESVPLLTKVLVMSALISAGCTSFGLVSPYQLVLDWPKVINKFEIWRIFTTFFFCGGFSFNLLMHLLVLYENCRRYESNPYNTGTGGNSADMLWMLLICGGVLLALSYGFELMLLSEELLYVILYVWSRREPNLPLNLFGVVRLKSLYLPWAYVAMRLFMGGSITEAVIGIAVGHLYYFFVEVFPLSHGYTLIRTPKFCLDVIQWIVRYLPSPIGMTNTGFNVFPPSAARASTGTAPAAPATAQRSTGHQWGRGRALGSN